MTVEVPLYTLAGGLAAYPFEIEISGDAAEVRLSDGLCGRNVSEDYTVSELRSLTEGSGVVLNDALGLILSSEADGTILVTVSVGSGNERFVLKPEELDAALTKI